MAANKTNTINPFITVDDGSRRVPIQNTQGEEIGAFTFHPTDIGIVKRYNEMVDEFSAITEPLEALSQVEGEEGDLRFIEAQKEAGERLYAAVDKLLGSKDAAAAFFGSMDPFSPVGGLFYCERVLQALGAFISAEFDAETKKFSSRAAKYLKK